MVRSFLWFTTSVITILSSSLLAIAAPIVHVLAVAWTWAFPPLAARTPFVGVMTTEQLVYARFRARTAAYSDRRLQRDPLAMPAGCGVSLAM